MCEKFSLIKTMNIKDYVKSDSDFEGILLVHDKITEE